MLAKGSLLAIGGVIAPVVAETVHGVTIFSRHGDRTSKHYSGYALTNLGFQENFQVGGDYRNIYLSSASPKRILGISENKHTASQIFASAPDQAVLLNTATAFLQGLYPPLEGLDKSVAVQTLNNGTTYTNPLNGYQYVTLHGEETESPDTIWIKGDDACPAYTKAAATFEESTEFTSRVESTKSFYEGFWGTIQNVYDYKYENMSYENAYDIFDLINVASIHNASVANITKEDLYQLKTLADSYEWGFNYNTSIPMRSIGGRTLAGAIVRQLNQTVTGKGKLKFSLLAGSYDTFMAFFGMAKLPQVNPDFYGLPDYAATMAFELFTEANMTAFPTNLDDLKVRFTFRNGSDDGDLPTAYPLFGSNQDSLKWTDFVSSMKTFAVSSVEQWCGLCTSTEDFCLPYQTETAGPAATPSTVVEASHSSMSNAVAGVIGAMVTLGVFILLGAIAFFVLRSRKATPAPVADAATAEKANSLSSGSNK